MKPGNYLNLFIFLAISFFFSATFLSSLPLVINLNYEINLVSIINNLILVPFVSVIIYPLCLINLILPIDYVLTFFINILEFLNNFLYSLSLTIVVPKIYYPFLILYYSLLVIKKYVKSKIIYLLFYILIIYSYIYPSFNKNTYIYFLDVGNADSILLVGKYKKEVILIDTGGKVNYIDETWKKQNNSYDAYENIELFLKRKVYFT